MTSTICPLVDLVSSTRIFFPGSCSKAILRPITALLKVPLRALVMVTATEQSASPKDLAHSSGLGQAEEVGPSKPARARLKAGRSSRQSSTNSTSPTRIFRGTMSKERPGSGSRPSRRSQELSAAIFQVIKGTSFLNVVLNTML